MKKLLKNPLLLLVIGFILGYITSVIADTINSNEVLYDNSNSNSSSANVQNAIDDLYDITNHTGVTHSLLAHNPVGLTTNLVGGLYRYQGVQNSVVNVNNYICFATTNKNICTSDYDKYMYRIIGINTSGQMKLIKKEALNTAYAWDSTNPWGSINSPIGVEWPYSELFNGLNGSYYLENTTYIPDSSWANRIATMPWNYATFTNKNVDAATMYANEMNSQTVSAKIGILYLHDYYYGLPGGNNCSSSASICKTSWIYLFNNDSSAPDTTNEWLLTRYNHFIGWSINNNGMLYNGDYNSYGNSASWNKTLATPFSVRPVFYLNSSQSIASGSGTITDPYILS